jgi:hypothetical protein
MSDPIPGKLRVGKYDYKTKKMPVIDGYTNILIHTTGALSPYVMKDEDGIIMENWWQFHKIWENVHQIRQPISTYDNATRWEYPDEKHLEIGDGKMKILKEYYVWQQKGLHHSRWVRYPNGFKYHKDAKGTVYRGKIIGYVEARKKVYYAKYREIAIKRKMFKDLKTRFLAGENIQIVEVDGPTKGTSYPYDKVQVKDGLGSLKMTKRRLNALINNPEQAFGHGYCVAAMLLNINKFE